MITIPASGAPTPYAGGIVMSRGLETEGSRVRFLL